MSEMHQQFERDLDTRLSKPYWDIVWPARSGTYYVCPLCGALVPREENRFDDAGRLAESEARSDARERHIAWHKELGG